MPRTRPRARAGGAGGGVAAEMALGQAAVPASRGASLVEQTLAIARRAVVRTTRQRALIIFPMIFPLILFAINGSALSPATRIPGFPTHNYRDFLIAMPFVQGAMFVSISAGVDLAKDIETGFLNRLAMTPVRGEALLVGQLGGALVLGVIQAIVYLLVGLASGVTFASGVGGAVVLLILSILISFAFASLGVLLALRFGSGEAVQGVFPLLFVTIFLSSSSLPRNLIKASWFRDVATYNPVSYLLEALRSLVITGWDTQALALGFGFALALLVIALGFSQARDEIEADADMMRFVNVARGVALALDPQHARQPGDPRPVDHLPAVLPDRLRGWPLAHQRRARAFTTRRGTPRFSSSSCSCSRRPSAASSPGSRSPATSIPALPGGCCSAPRGAAASSPATRSGLWGDGRSRGPSSRSRP